MYGKMFERIANYAGGRIIWMTSLFVSAALLALVFSFLDLRDLWQRLIKLDLVLLSAAVILILSEGVLTAFRIHLFTGKRTSFISALRANAWYSLLLIILPARLGEVAAIAIFRRFLNQKVGSAVASIVSQRVYDLVVLSMFTVVALLGLTDAVPRGYIFLFGGLVFCGGILVLWKLEFILTLLSLSLNRIFPQARGIRRIALQARIWTRHVFPARHVPAAIGWTSLKWMSNLGAIAFLLLSAGVDFTMLDGIVVAACYNFLAIIPLQTMGGFGVGEAGLMLLLGAFAVPATVAASVSIVVRSILIAGTILFWAIASGTGALVDPITPTNLKRRRGQNMSAGTGRPS